MTFIKLSVLVLYRRIFSQASSLNRYANYVVTCLVILSAIWLVVCNITTCVPLKAYWNPTVKGVCWSVQIWFFNSALHLITDYLVFMLPMPMLRRLNVPRKQHILLIGIFSIGFFVCLISIIRLVTLIRIESDPNQMLDMTYSTTPISLWNAVEINLGIVVACLMTMRPLAARVMPRWFASTLDRRSDRSGGVNGGPALASFKPSVEPSVRGALAPFEADICLERQTLSKPPSDISASTYAGDIDTSPSRPVAP